MMKGCCAGLSTVVGISLLVLGSLTILHYDPFINNVIYEEMISGMDGEFFTPNSTIDVTPVLNIYFFNVTNKDEFLAGSKPILQEVGPYVYWQEWHRGAAIKNPENNTVSGTLRKTYHFDRAASYGPQSDIITTLDIPMITAVWQVRFTPKFIQLIFSSMLEVLKKKPFTSRNVSDLVWGYEDPLLKMARDILPPEQRLPTDTFGFFQNTNNTELSMRNYRLGTPEDMSAFMDVFADNYKSELTFWLSKECNRVHGSDGSGFPPNVTRTTTLYFFISSLCRVLPLTFSKDTEQAGIKSYRFVPPKNVFADAEVEPENACYCTGEAPCIGGGLFNISICQYGAPAVISFPHFYEADQKYLDAVVGLKPVQEKHQFYVDVTPRTGSILAAGGRAQINFALTNVSEIKPADGLRPIIFPVTWFEDGVPRMSDTMASRMRMANNLPETIKTTMLSLSFVFGCVMLMGGLAIFISMMYNRSQDSEENGVAGGKSTSGRVHGISNPGLEKE